jgi:DNA-binding MarR family transcriptional regulator
MDFDPRDIGSREHERNGLDRDFDAREVFTRDVRLPRGLEREIVRDRDREYTLRGSESRTLATVGAFRVVSSRDLRDSRDRDLDPRSGDLRHLREQGLVETVRVPGTREHAVVLTREGRALLEHHRDRERDGHQTFYDGLRRERELEHDIHVYRAYDREANRLRDEHARIERVILDYQLKSEYQRWLHEPDRDRNNYDGHPDRTPEEIRDWAYEHDLPYFDDEVHIPDLRIEYELDGRLDHVDVEVITQHYRGAHAASVARSGFKGFRGSSARVGGAPFDPDYAEELWY